MTKLASIETRSTATETTNSSMTDGSSLQQWRSTQGTYFLEFRGFSTVSSRSLEQTRDPGRKLLARSPAAALDQSRDRIRSISLDMNALQKKSCSVEMANSSAPLSPRRPAVRLRALVQRCHHGGGPASEERRKSRTTKKRTRRNQRIRRSKKRACSDIIEESSSVDKVDARRKRFRSYRKSLYSGLTHTCTERTVCIPMRCGTKSASTSIFRLKPGSVMIFANPLLCPLR